MQSFRRKIFLHIFSFLGFVLRFELSTTVAMMPMPNDQFNSTNRNYLLYALRQLSSLFEWIFDFMLSS